MKKIGRPTDNPRVLRVAIRLNEEEMETLKKCAATLNVTMTTAIIKGIEKLAADMHTNK